MSDATLLYSFNAEIPAQAVQPNPPTDPVNPPFTTYTQQLVFNNQELKKVSYEIQLMVLLEADSFVLTNSNFATLRLGGISQNVIYPSQISNVFGNLSGSEYVQQLLFTFKGEFITYASYCVLEVNNYLAFYNSYTCGNVVVNKL